HTLARDPGDDELGTFAHGVDHVGKAAEEFKALLLTVDLQELVEGSAGAKSFISCRAQHNDARIAVGTGIMDLGGQTIQNAVRKRIALGMEEFNGGDPLVGLHVYIAVYLIF